MNAVLAGIASRLERDPKHALAEAEKLLRHDPAMAPAELIACQALRKLGRGIKALPRLETLAGRTGPVPAVLWELAQCSIEQGKSTTAVLALEKLTSQQPGVAAGWFALAQELRKLSRSNEAWRADLSGVHAAARDPELIQAAMAMNEGDNLKGISILDKRLSRNPVHVGEDAPALRLLGELHWREGNMNDALRFAREAVELAPGFDLARDFLVRLLLQTNSLDEAQEQAEILATSPVGNPAHDLLLASVLVRTGGHERAEVLYRRLLDTKHEQPQVWQNLGHVLKTMGKQADAVDAYREAVRQQPTMGEAWWSLANLKTAKLGPQDIARMEAALGMLDAAASERDEDRFHLHFALGKANEDAGAIGASFKHYEQGNRLRRAMITHDADDFAQEVEETARTFSTAILTEMGKGGCPAPDPIFIVGLPRAGSTLVEQILASHSQIEGTMELPEMMIIAGRLQSRVDDGEFGSIAEMMASLTPADRLRLGEEYMEKTRTHRHSDKPLFIDKMPNNWQHVGLISMILPNARIIDARRHPMSCCFSGWKQHFARGQTFSYDLDDIARYYRDYARLMAKFDEAAPGKVHRVIYETMVEDTEAQIRKLLDYLDLPFEQACLDFHTNKRAVRTASSEQVRQPIFRTGIDGWKEYAPYLESLRMALEPIEDIYPAIS